jgi:hypothetical protein
MEVVVIIQYPTAIKPATICMMLKKEHNRMIVPNLCIDKQSPWMELMQAASKALAN